MTDTKKAPNKGQTQLSVPNPTKPVAIKAGQDAEVFSAEKFFAEKYRESNIAEFFRRNLHMLGYSGPVRNMTTIVHEFVTNGLDACEESKVAPDILVEIKQLGERHYVVAVQDNGTGIPESYIPKLLGKMLAGTKFHRYIQSRGQQGIGAVGAIMFSHMTAGKPIKIVTSTGDGVITTAVMDIDIKKNEPHIYEITKSKGNWHGTKIISEYKDVVYNKGEQGVYEYIRRTAMANPHAKLTLVEPDGNKVAFDRTVSKPPAQPKEMLPHPLGIVADDLRIMAAVSASRNLRSFLEGSFSRMSSGKVKEIEKIAKGVDFSVDPKELSHQQAEHVVQAFQQVKFIAPATEGLVPIGEEQIEKSMREILQPEFFSVVTRPPSVYKGGIPFQVEVGLAFSGGAGKKGQAAESEKKKEEGGVMKAELMRFSNRVPLLFDTGGCAITQAVKTVDWKRYDISNFEEAPITVVVNVISSHIPYTSAGKQAIADDDDIMKELRFALMDAGRKLRLHLAGIRRDRMKAERKAIFERYIPEIATSLALLTGEKQSEIRGRLEKMLKERIKVIEAEAEAAEAEAPKKEGG